MSEGKRTLARPGVDGRMSTRNSLRVPTVELKFLAAPCAELNKHESRVTSRGHAVLTPLPGSERAVAVLGSVRRALNNGETPLHGL
jgi:hypothetical protein